MARDNDQIRLLDGMQINLPYGAMKSRREEVVVFEKDKAIGLIG